MAYRFVAGMLQDFRRLLRGSRTSGSAGDAALLEEFVRARSQDAFASLVERHGPLVIGVCRRILGREHDLEDAFQATFFVLARKAHTIRRSKSLCGWLARVARRVALTVRKQQSRRREQVGATDEALRAASTESDPARRAEQRDTAAVIGREIERLPEKYRMLVILCDLQGRTHAEAAQELSWPQGSIGRHLARGRELLRERLARRGLSVGAVVLPALLADTVEAAVPTSWVKAAAMASASASIPTTIPTGLVSERAFTLSQGVLKAMWLKQLCVFVLMPLALGILMVGVVIAARFVGDASSPQPAAPIALANPVGENKGGKDAEQPKPAQSEKLKKLLKERVAEAKKLHDGFAEQEQQGRLGDYHLLIYCKEVLLKAEIDACTTKEERLQVYKNAINDASALEMKIQAQVQQKKNIPPVLSMVTTFRLGIECDVEREKSAK